VALAVLQVDREKIAGAGDAVAAVIGHFDMYMLKWFIVQLFLMGFGRG
jgi:hypothetical protein